MSEQKKREITLDDCKRTLEGTLAHFGISRGLSVWEETQLQRAIKKFGPEMVELALFGARFEKKTEKFDPKDYFSLARILERDREGRERIDMYANFGARKRKSENTPRARAEEPAQETFTTDPARVREIIGKAFSRGGSKTEELSEQEIERRKQEQLRRLREMEGKS